MKNNKNVKFIIKIAIAVVMVAFLVIVALHKVIFPADSFFYNLYEEAFMKNIWVRIIKSVVIIFGGILVIYVANFITLAGKNQKNNTIKTLTLLFGSILKYVCVIAMILVVLAAFGVDISVLVTSVGVLSLIVGLGCQSLVSDIVAGLFMIFEGDIKVGDVVVINGWRGTVLQIGLRRTKIEDSVGNVNIVNNSSISNIINNTRNHSYAICDVGIEYNESIERVESILANNMNRFKEDIPAIIEGPFYKGVQELGASAVVIRLLAKCSEMDKFQVERDMNREIKMLFDENNVNIPFDQIVVNYRDENEQHETISKEEINNAHKFVKEQRKLSSGIEDINK